MSVQYPFAIRRATTADKPAVVAIARAFEEDDWVIAAYDALVSVPEPQGLYVAEADGRVVACYNLEVAAPGSVYFSAMRVDPNYRGKGFGSLFCRAQVEQARAVAPGDIYLLSVLDNVPAHRTVQKNGFERLGEWCAYAEVVPRDLGAPTRARAATPADIALVRAAQQAQAADRMAGVIAAGTGYAIRTLTEADLDPACMAVVGGPGVLEGYVRYEVVEDFLLVSLLEGTPEAAADLLAFAAAAGAQAGVRAWEAGLRRESEPLLQAWGLDPDTAWRAYAFCMPAGKPLPDLA